MHTASISQLEKNIDETVLTAIIYSISDLAEYIIEIRHNSENYFIGSKEDPQRFGNLGEAVTAARSHKAEKAYLALNKTYQEVEASNNQSIKGDRYDYMPLDLSGTPDRPH